MNRILIMGLGNTLYRDDAVGIAAAREVQKHFSDEPVDIVECAEHGMSLLDYFIGYRRAILMDAIHTGSHPPGTLFEINPAHLGTVLAPSPHYSGLPEMIKIAEQLNLDFPETFKIFGMEIEDMHTMQENLTDPVRRALPEMVHRVLETARNWLQET